METSAAARVAGLPRTQLTMVYDGQGRRVQRSVTQAPLAGLVDVRRDYFANDSLSGPVASTVYGGKIDDRGLSFPPGSSSYRVTATLTVPTTGNWTLQAATAGGGTRLYVDNVLVVDAWDTAATTPVTLPLVGGSVHALRYEFRFFGGASPSSQLNWSGPDRSLQAVPNAADTTGPAVTTTTRYLYDGWNLLAEISSAGSAVRTYTWGLDLSGSTQGAGGVGGLLAITNVGGVPSPRTDFAAYDGNGNVTALVRADDGSLSAKYDYNAFGETILAEGSFAAGNPFRFSTKFADDETGLVYYGFRYYNPNTGRWPSRDPIEEDGGVNLYAFVGNEPTDQFDPLGLEDAQADFVSKSFINGIPTIGSFKGAVATRRLQLFAQAVGKSDAFNQNPASDAKDGKYRLYTRVTIKASCCENAAPTVTIISTDKDGGSEGPLSGTINLSKPDLITSGSTVNVHWKGWGRPNMTAPELGMQMVKTRTSRNIWHDVTIIVSCKDGKPSFQEGALKVSKFPSFRPWKDGQPKGVMSEGPVAQMRP